jgi:hypothetical protein
MCICGDLTNGRRPITEFRKPALGDLQDDLSPVLGRPGGCGLYAPLQRSRPRRRTPPRDLGRRRFRAARAARAVRPLPHFLVPPYFGSKPNNRPLGNPAARLRPEAARGNSPRAGRTRPVYGQVASFATNQVSVWFIVDSALAISPNIIVSMAQRAVREELRRGGPPLAHPALPTRPAPSRPGGGFPHHLTTECKTTSRVEETRGSCGQKDFASCWGR